MTRHRLNPACLAFPCEDTGTLPKLLRLDVG